MKRIENIHLNLTFKGQFTLVETTTTTSTEGQTTTTTETKNFNTPGLEFEIHGVNEINNFVRAAIDGLKKK